MRLFVVLIALTVAACGGPLRRMSALAEVPGPPNQPCVRAALENADAVLGVNTNYSDTLGASIAVPEGIPQRYASRRQTPDVGIEISERTDDGQFLQLSMSWVGGSETPEFESYARSVLDRLADGIRQSCNLPD
jgi:hypothetical protein